MTPSNESPLPYRPVTQVAPETVPVLLLPDESPACVPEPSSNAYDATRPVEAAPPGPAAVNMSGNATTARAMTTRSRRDPKEAGMRGCRFVRTKLKATAYATSAVG